MAVISTHTCGQCCLGHGRSGWVAKGVIGQSPQGVKLKGHEQGRGREMVFTEER